jgi:osmotically-inducible protein OsmY
MTESRTTRGTELSLDDLTAVMEAADIFVSVSIRDGALVLEGEVDSEEVRQAALDLAGGFAKRAGLTIEDAMEVLEIDIELGPGEYADVDSADLSPMDASTLTDVGTIDPGLASDEAIPYFPPTDTVIGEQLIEQDEVEVIGGFEPTSEDHDEEDVSLRHLEDDERITDDVRKELRQDATTTDLAHIAVTTFNRVVHLRGTVETLEDAENAEEVAGRVPGVAEVREDLKVLGLEADRDR